LGGKPYEKRKDYMKTLKEGACRRLSETLREEKRLTENPKGREYKIG
jgi:hypothetical protein